MKFEKTSKGTRVLDVNVVIDFTSARFCCACLAFAVRRFGDTKTVTLFIILAERERLIKSDGFGQIERNLTQIAP